jgi:predicted AlkP superfamily pyrophosphatase or phosphodiesterase
MFTQQQENSIIFLEAMTAVQKVKNNKAIVNYRYLGRWFCTILLAGITLAFTFPVKGPKPIVILISLDGFRYDYLEKFQPPHLQKLAGNGVKAQWLIPAYPTKTFPNHYTVATGLYPDNHGLFENNIYDKEDNTVFGLNKREEVQNPKWWGGEPIWVTAEKQGKIAAAYFFPGTETMIQGRRPSYWKDYDHNFPNTQRVDTVLKWLDLPVEKRPELFTMYFSDVDDAGHAYGPDAEETRLAVMKVDSMIGRLVSGIASRKLQNVVNLIITSDHGMVSYTPSNALLLENMFDTTMAEKIFWVGEFTQIFPKPGKEEEIYESIRSKLPPTARVVKRGEFPPELKFGKNKRIAPIVVVPGEGVVIMNNRRYEQYKQRGELDKIRGAHGYDNRYESMRATFIASGPAFKKNLTYKPFENIHIYNLMCSILGLTPAENDGDFRVVRSMLKKPKALPLK